MGVGKSPPAKSSPYASQFGRSCQSPIVAGERPLLGQGRLARRSSQPERKRSKISRVWTQSRDGPNPARSPLERGVPIAVDSVARHSLRYRSIRRLDPYWAHSVRLDWRVRRRRRAPPDRPLLPRSGSRAARARGPRIKDSVSQSLQERSSERLQGPPPGRRLGSAEARGHAQIEGAR